MASCRFVNSATSFKLINIKYTVLLIYIQEDDQMFYLPKLRPLPCRDRQSLLRI